MATAATIDRRLAHRAAARREAEAAEAAAWLDAHEGELRGITHEPAHVDEVIDGAWSNTDADDDWDGEPYEAPTGRLTEADREAAADAARAAIEDRLNDPDLPGWGTTFDPADVQWGFTTHRSPHTLPGAVSGRPQPAHLAR